MLTRFIYEPVLTGGRTAYLVYDRKNTMNVPVATVYDIALAELIAQHGENLPPIRNKEGG